MRIAADAHGRVIGRLRKTGVASVAIRVTIVPIAVLEGFMG